MAGSYLHCCDPKNGPEEEYKPDYLGQFKFWAIENMGDAHEACEQMHWMIQFLAEGKRERIKIAEKSYYKMCRERRVSDA